MDDSLCHFSASDNVSVTIANLNEHALRWAVAQAVGESIEVEISADYRYIDIVCQNRWDGYHGDPMKWGPDLNLELASELMVKYLLTVGPSNAEGTRWLAQSFARPECQAEADTPAKAICLVLLHQHYGNHAVVPRQLQHYEQCRREVQEARERVAAQLRQDDQNDRYYELQDTFR